MDDSHEIVIIDVELWKQGQIHCKNNQNNNKLPECVIKKSKGIAENVMHMKWNCWDDGLVICGVTDVWIVEVKDQTDSQFGIKKGTGWKTSGKIFCKSL